MHRTFLTIRNHQISCISFSLLLAYFFTAWVNVAVPTWALSARFTSLRPIGHQIRTIQSTPAAHRRSRERKISLSTSESEADQIEDNGQGIDLSLDPRLYKVRLSRATGIEWGTDLSFSFVYVRAMDPTGSAALSSVVGVGDQICECTPVIPGDDASTFATMQPVNLIGASFDYVMGTLASLERNIAEIDVVLFRGSKADLKAICTGRNVTPEPEFVTVTVVQNKGGEQEMIQRLRAEVGVNVRELLVSNGINVYQSVTRWTNCNGKQLCGTCIVNIPAGGTKTNRKSMDEASTLRENPDSYRLSCITFAYGDITVETFPPINAAQWTR